MTARRLWCLLVSLWLLCSLAGCVSPATRLDQLATQQGFERDRLNVGGYRLLVYRNAQAASRDIMPPRRLHVYLEGDGSPWRHRTVIMADPTPRQPLMLELMRLDRQPAVYLGRPCYNGTSADADCDNALWTSDRYSQTVIDSMAAGLRVLVREQHARELWLMGHSGGGALAMLLARKVPEVTRVVTVAGNLDIDAWTLHHGYTPLFGSVNPAELPPLRPSVWQWHLVGGRDSVIPPPLVRRFIMQQPQASGILLRRFSHGCCWQLMWSRVLDALEQGDPARIPGVLFKQRDEHPEAEDNR